MSTTINQPSPSQYDVDVDVGEATSGAVSDASVLPLQHPGTDVARQLRAETTAVRLRIRWPGVRKTLTDGQKQRAAQTFAADVGSVTASKKLLDTDHPAFRAATAVKTRAVDYWKRTTLPYVEPGTRLLRRRDVNAFDVELADLRSQLERAVDQIDLHHAQLVELARERLGDLFDADDYARNLGDLFAIQWDYPSCDPPEYLRALSPQLYEAECQRMQQRFGEAVELAVQAFADELTQLVSHLAERLSGDNDGRPKVFRDSAVNNLLDFFERFQRLSIRSDDQLDELVRDARAVLGGFQPQQLRDQPAFRQHVADELCRVESSLEGYLLDRPRRNILRRPR